MHTRSSATRSRSLPSLLGCVQGFFVACTLAAAIGAQNLANHNFDQAWLASGTGWQPPHWSVVWPADFVEPETAPGLVHCGVRSCRLDTRLAPGFAQYHFGKQWDNVPVGTVLRAKVRFRCSDLNGARVEIIAGEYDNSWVLQGHQMHVVQPSADWQEVTLAHTTLLVPTTGVTNRLRLLFRLVNTPLTVMHVDNIDFAGSSSVLGSLEAPICWEGRGTDLSMLLDLQTGYVREIRKLSGSVPNGPNLLIDGGSPLATLLKTSAIANPPGSLEVVDDGVPAPNVALPSPVWQVQSLSSTGIVVAAMRAAAAIGGSLPNDVGLQVAIDAPPGMAGFQCSHVLGAGSTSGTTIVEGVTCPKLELRRHAAVAQGAEDWLFLPTGDGSTIRLRELTGSVNERTSHYPGNASMQFAAYYAEPDGGLTIRAEDRNGEAKELVFAVAHSAGAVQHVALAWRHKLPSLTAAAQTYTPYWTVVDTCGDTWMSAAEKYRVFAATTPWYQQARRKANDLSDWVPDRPTVFDADLQVLGVNAEVVPINEWACVLDRWRSQLASGSVTTRMLPLFRSFENKGTFASPFYFPLNVHDTAYGILRSEADIHSAWDMIEAADHLGMTMMAGMKYAVNRAELTPCQAGGPWESWWAPQFVGQTPAPTAEFVQNRSGVVLSETPVANWDLQKCYLDPTHQIGLTLHTDAAKALAEFGRVDVYLFDQMNGGELRDNFSPAYLGAGGPPHEPGDGSWKCAALANLFDSTLSTGRQVNQRFELAIEDPCEWSLPWIAIQGLRVDRVTGWPGPSKWPSEVQWSCSVVPAFSFVYSGTSAFIVWDILGPTANARTWGWFAADYAAQRERCFEGIGRAVAAGAFCFIGATPWELLLEYKNAAMLGPCPNIPQRLCNPTGTNDAMFPVPASVDAEYRALVTNLTRTEQGPALTFLNDGIWQATGGFSVQGAPTMFSVNAWRGLDATSRPLYPVVHAARTLGSQTGILLVNVDPVAGVSHSVNLPTTVGGVSPGASLAKLYVNGVFMMTRAYSSLSPLTLGPQDVAFVTY